MKKLTNMADSSRKYLCSLGTTGFYRSNSNRVYWLTGKNVLSDRGFDRLEDAVENYCTFLKKGTKRPEKYVNNVIEVDFVAKRRK